MARNSVNETMECHAYLCNKPKIAQAVTLTVSKAFELATDIHNEKVITSPNKETNKDADKTVTKSNNVKISENKNSTVNQPIPRLSSPKASQDIFNSKSHHSSKWQNFEDENLDEDDCFSMLAVGRTKGLQGFRTDLRQEDIDDGVNQYINGNTSQLSSSKTSSMEDLMCM